MCVVMHLLLTLSVNRAVSLTGSSVSSPLLHLLFHTFVFTAPTLTCHMVGTPAAPHFELMMIRAVMLAWSEYRTQQILAC